jgi:hypothetical protein
MMIWRGATERTLKRADGTPYVHHQKPSVRYRCTNRKDPHRVSVKAPDVERWFVLSLFQLLGAVVAEHAEQPDLTPLIEQVELTRSLWEQVRTPEMQSALGTEWPATVQARREDHEQALTALGEAQVAAGTAEVASVTDLKEAWPSMTLAEQRDTLDLYGARVRCNGKTRDTWELILP